MNDDFRKPAFRRLHDDPDDHVFHALGTALTAAAFGALLYLAIFTTYRYFFN